MKIRNFATIWLAKKIKVWTFAQMASRPPDQIIGRDNEPYLLRWIIRQRQDGKKSKLGNIYLHKILRPDHDVPHDHPWWSLSIVLEGPLSEVRRTRLFGDVKRHFSDGDLVIRSPWAKHALYLPQDYPALTFFIVGPRLRRWGFHCDRGWLHWKEFDRRGGCGEVS